MGARARARDQRLPLPNSPPDPPTPPSASGSVSSNSVYASPAFQLKTLCLALPIPASPTASPQGPTARAFDRLLEKHLMFSDPSLSLVPGEYVLLDFADDSGEFGHSAPPDDDDAPEDSMDVDTPPTSSRSDEVVADKDKRKQVRSARPLRTQPPF